MKDFIRSFWRQGIKIHLLWVLIVLILAQWVFWPGAFAVTWLQVLVGVAVGGVVDVALTWFRKRIVYLPQSGFITGLIVASILAPESAFWQVALAAAIAIAAKHVIRYQGRHIFNPAAAGLAAVILLGAVAGWWLDQWPWLVAALGAFIVTRTRKWPTVFAFLLIWFLGSALQLGLKGAASTTPLFFAAVMLIEPTTTPAVPRLQLVYGAVVGVLAVILATRTPLGVLAALLAGNLTTPLIMQYSRAAVFWRA